MCCGSTGQALCALLIGIRDLEEARVKAVAQMRMNLRKAYRRGRAARDQQSPKSFHATLVGIEGG